MHKNLLLMLFFAGTMDAMQRSVQDLSDTTSLYGLRDCERLDEFVDILRRYYADLRYEVRDNMIFVYGGKELLDSYSSVTDAIVAFPPEELDTTYYDEVRAEVMLATLDEQPVRVVETSRILNSADALSEGLITDRQADSGCRAMIMANLRVLIVAQSGEVLMEYKDSKQACEAADMDTFEKRSSGELKEENTHREAQRNLAIEAATTAVHEEPTVVKSGSRLNRRVHFEPSLD